MFFKRKNFLVFVWMLSTSCLAVYDVSDVFFQGDSTLMGMKIESSYFKNGAFLIETTGARFEYVNDELKLYQGLDANTRRLLSTIVFDNEPNFVKVEANDDHVLFWSKDLNLGIYGDSTCIIAPKIKQQLKCRGNFKPDYEGRYKGELLLIDDLGGMEIYPQRYETGYKIIKIKLERSDWIADYDLNAGERVMVAAFPGRPFDWEKSFKSHMIVTTGTFAGNELSYPFGIMPPDSTIKRWSEFLNIIVVDHNGLWPKNSGPYIVVNKPEFRRLIATAQKYKMKVAVHSSLFYFFRKNNDSESFYRQVKAVYDKYGIDGVYIDGLCFDYEGRKHDNKILNWEIVRRLRQLVGGDGVIAIHDTSAGSPVGTVPNIDSYCDAVWNGENIPFKSFEDPYIKYQVRKYGISNTIALWLREGQPDHITDNEAMDALLAMNGRGFWGAHAFWRRIEPNAKYRYYMKRLAPFEKAYRIKKAKIDR